MNTTADGGLRSADTPTLRLVLSKDNLVLDDYVVLEDIEDGETPKLRELRAFLVRHMVDEAGQPVPARQAQRLVGGFTLEELKEAIKNGMEALTESIVPLASKPRSSAPSMVAAVRPGSTGLSRPKSGDGLPGNSSPGHSPHSRLKLRRRRD